MKNAVKQLLIFAAVLFGVLLVIDGIVVRVIDRREERDGVLMNVSEHALVELDAIEENTDAVNYSPILGRNLTENEEREQKILEAESNLLLHNNLGMAKDFVLPDGNWFLKEDSIHLYLSTAIEDGVKYHLVFTLQHPEILERYRSYWKDNYYSYDKNSREMTERYRYYQLVFERFYMDDMKILPEQVRIYKVERMPINGAEYPMITGVELMETLEFEVPNKDEFPCYELTTKIDNETVSHIVYDYVRDGEVEYSMWSNCTLNGKVFSLDERKKLLEESLKGDHTSRKRDFIGFSNYHYDKRTYDSRVLGGEVTIVSCEPNIYFEMCRYGWQWVLLIILAEFVVSLGSAAIVIAIKLSKKKKQ